MQCRMPFLILCDPHAVSTGHPADVVCQYSHTCLQQARVRGGAHIVMQSCR